MAADDKILNVAIVGLGHLHPRGYMSLFENCGRTRVVSAYDPDAALVERFVGDYGINGYSDIDEIFESEKLDMAVIFLPHCDCADAAIKFAQRGVHLMIEKPIAHTSADVKRLMTVADAKGVKITTGYCWRYHPVIKQMKECIENGVLGDIVSVEARLAAGKVERYIAGNSAWMLEKARSGGGPMYNLGVHWIDIINYLLVDSAVEVCACNTQTSDKYDIEDSSIAMLKFGSGVTAMLSVSYVVPDCFPCGRDLYLGVKGSKGVLSYCPKYEGEQAGGAVQTDVLEIYSDSEKMAGAAARQYSFQLDKVPGYSGYMGQAYVDDFVNAIFQGQEPFIGVDEALDVLKVVEAIYQSDRDKKWIEVK